MKFSETLFNKHMKGSVEIKRFDYCYTGVEIFKLYNFNKFSHNAKGCLHRNYKCSDKPHLMNKILVDMFEMIVDDMVEAEELTHFQFPSKRATFIRIAPLSDNSAKKSRMYGKYGDVDVFATNFKIYSFTVEIEKPDFNKSFILYTNTKAYKCLMEKANMGYKF